MGIPRADERSDMEKIHVMIFLSYTGHNKTFQEIDELQSDIDYGTSREGICYIPEPCDILFCISPLS
jgi:hypothetical protein